MNHKADCKRVFKRYDLTCPRCIELNSGAPARKWTYSHNWQMKHGKGPAYEAFKRALKEHNCKERGCGIVCTAFDW